jgi:hypothetical protein
MASLLNYLLFQLGWLSCVLGAATNRPWQGMALAGALLAVHLGLSGETSRQLAVIVTAAVIGMIIDTLQMWRGVVCFPSEEGIRWLAPLWIGLLWMQFATLLPFSLRWLSRRYALASILGMVGGPLAYYVGEKLGAIIVLPPRPLHYATMAIIWAAALPAVVWFADRLELVDAVGGRYRGLA